MIDFRKVARKLREQLQANQPVQMTARGLVGNPLSPVTRRALVSAEEEMAAQALLYLYDHLTYHEQWRAAATLLAFCQPLSIMHRRDVLNVVEQANALASKIDDPEKELAAYLAKPPHKMPDSSTMEDHVTSRAKYWMHVVCLSRAKRALEYATGCGTNVMQAARLFPEVEWVGADKPEQVHANGEQSNRLGLKCHWLHDGMGGLPFDVVAVLDTIEHTVYPDELLSKAEAYCKPGGLMVVSVPNGPWSLHTPNDQITLDTPGNHVAVQSAATLIPYLQQRGQVIDAYVLPGECVEFEGNTVLCVTYELKA